LLKNYILADVLRWIINSCSISWLISIIIFPSKVKLNNAQNCIILHSKFYCGFSWSYSCIPFFIFLNKFNSFCSVCYHSVDFDFVDVTYFRYELQECTRLIIPDVVMQNYVFFLIYILGEFRETLSLFQWSRNTASYASYNV
jgi:hypothetical protein